MSKPGTFISSGRTATSRRSSRAKIRLCIFASIFELLPLVQSSERALLLKVRITCQCKQLAYVCQQMPRAGSPPEWFYNGSSGSRCALRRELVAGGDALERAKLHRIEGA